MNRSSSKTRSSSSLLTLAAAFAVVFLLTALMGVWAAYDRSSAWQALRLIALGLALAAAVVAIGRLGGNRALGLLSVAMAFLAGAIGVYFLLAYDWTAGTEKFALLQRIGLWVQAHRPAIALSEDINANVAANGLILSLFLGLGGLLWAIRERLGLLLLVTLPPWLAGLAALVLTMSRGAWLGAGAGMLAMIYLLLRRRVAGNRPLRLALDLVALAASLLVAAAFWAAVRSPDAVQALGSVPAGGSAISRATLWRDGLDLVADYPFTGSGLRSTMMVYSSYGLLLHVGYILHMHNLFVQIAVEQGVMACLAFLGLLAVAAANVLAVTRRGCRAWRFGLAAGGALAALAINGMLDAGVYGSLLAPVLFLPIGFALAADPGPSKTHDRLRDWPLAVGLITAAAFLLIVIIPAGRAMVQTNLAAVAQTRAELSVYTWPVWPLQDELRRSPEIDLAPAIARYQAALALNPRNAAANRRLGQIELSRGEYESARSHLEAAYAVAPGNRATRQMLAESYAIAGDTAAAAAIFRTVDTGNGQIDARLFWYEHIGEPERAERIRSAERKYHNE